MTARRVGSGTVRRVGERGFSLIELGIVVAVIGILATVVLVGRGFLSSSRASKAVELIRTIHSGVNFYCANHNDTTAGITLAVLQADGKVPTPAALGGGQFTVNTIVQNGANPNRYDITFTCDPDQGRLCDEVCAHEVANTTIYVAGGPCVPLQLTYTMTYTR